MVAFIVNSGVFAHRGSLPPGARFVGAAIAVTVPVDETTATVASESKWQPVMTTVTLFVVVPAAGSTDSTVGGAASTTFSAFASSPEHPFGLTTRSVYEPLVNVSAGTTAVMLVLETNAV